MASYIPDGYSTVTPWIIGPDTAGLIEFLQQAFGANELSRITGRNGRIEHAEIRVHGAIVMAFDRPRGWPPTPAFVRLYVEDCDATFARAIRAGGTMISGCKALASGDRVGRMKDPFGNIWWLQTHVEDLTADVMEARAKQTEYVEAMKYLQDTLASALR
ncbi:glyoxalase/Bleomycin resistance protein/Dioxygenase superfamily protein [Asticcacaulis biprosthecium C19]|uniref:Glyoxalase/Bleomycin resistance protein/Dioxygenase superfamily protein n=1 Tax=Asticcacaulis biprosthecium C19 TaxID=715226 RepID=F4QM52_9CAUL|nr:VOC family protein [Asticcacaulis biprosthecium]EGF93624.1 glyoxalase/Bleomycin resistance protein/Dioxygenase superfamily protein [Asticcacaulis biprosthecium C19]